MSGGCQLTEKFVRRLEAHACRHWRISPGCRLTAGRRSIFWSVGHFGAVELVKNAVVNTFKS
jgi:hypothetical protein